jgi:hypothetical protein
MNRFVPRLDEATVRREFPIVNLVDGWFFRCREVAVGGVHRVEGTDLWGTRVSAEGTDCDKLFQDCVKSAAGIKRHTKEILFHEYGTQLRLEDNELVLDVLCGGVGQFGVEFVLNDTERDRYRHEGDSFVKELAETVRRTPNPYAKRGRFC